ncbi:hypothetical protein BJV78DRAFT_1135124 [Lactifluus subvellereus]|nr:hypothetical protein BJV78DRAFT_1135124 [Lactifluus subvellereus]
MTRTHTVPEIQKLFLSSPRYAVVGASRDQSKYGTKVLQWYLARNFSVTPVHPVRSLSPLSHVKLVLTRALHHPCRRRASSRASRRCLV